GDDGVADQPRLRGEDQEVERELRGPAGDTSPEAPQVRALTDAAARRAHLGGGGDEDGECHGDQNELCPDRRRTGRGGPAGDKREDGGGSEGRATQVVDHLPPRGDRTARRD